MVSTTDIFEIFLAIFLLCVMFILAYKPVKIEIVNPMIPNQGELLEKIKEYFENRYK